MPKGVKRETLAATVGVPSSDKMYHPQVEKARRDRINRLLNELRVLVPCAPDQLTNGVDKRPKHIVLQDTIELLKRMLSPSPGMFHVHIGPHLGGAGGGVSSGTQQGDSSGNEHATVLQSVPFSSDDAEDLSWAAQ